MQESSIYVINSYVRHMYSFSLSLSPSPPTYLVYQGRGSIELFHVDPPCISVVFRPNALIFGRNRPSRCFWRMACFFFVICYCLLLLLLLFSVLKKMKNPSDFIQTFTKAVG